MSKSQTTEVTTLLQTINLIRARHANTLPSIERATGLGRAAVTHRIEQAKILGFVDDEGPASPSGGRAPKNFRFRSESGYLVSCLLENQQVRVAITDLEGVVLRNTTKIWRLDEGPAKAAETVLVIIDDLISKLFARPIWGIVLGLPGPVDPASGQPELWPMLPGWNRTEIRRCLEDRFDCPVWIEKDINLLAMGAGAHRDGYPDMVYVRAGFGIDAALVSNGRILRGTSGVAGEIGHSRILGSETICRCGRAGCLEAVASGWAIIREAGRAVGEGADSSLVKPMSNGSLTVETIVEAAANGDSLALRLLQYSAKALGTAVAALVTVFNPAKVLIAGPFSSVNESYLAGVRQRIYELSPPLNTKDLAVIPTPIREEDFLRGGTELALEQLFYVHFERWFKEGRPHAQISIPRRQKEAFTSV